MRQQCIVVMRNRQNIVKQITNIYIQVIGCNCINVILILLELLQLDIAKQIN